MRMGWYIQFNTRTQLKGIDSSDLKYRRLIFGFQGRSSAKYKR
jgi:hypothetical protein